MIMRLLVVGLLLRLSAAGPALLYIAMPQSVSHSRSFYPLAGALRSIGLQPTILSESVKDEGFRCLPSLLWTRDDSM